MKEEKFTNNLESSTHELPGVNNIELELLKKTFSHFKDVKKIILFGSRIEGGFSDKSDLDIFIETNSKNRGKISDVKNKIQELLSDTIPYPLHIKDLGEIQNKHLLWNINNNGKQIF
ncbi:nucleotidyltransferase domain-containing protein [Candidatus Parcubacteria bacterium]|nr:nucleotidyltransferase domain-containing protein [Candidatus Parcubacteria bacterium]